MPFSFIQSLLAGESIIFENIYQHLVLLFCL